jgi:hypothetical protein
MKFGGDGMRQTSNETSYHIQWFSSAYFSPKLARSYFCGKRYAQQETSNTFIQIYIFLLKYVLQNNTSKSMRTKGIIQVHT